MATKKDIIRIPQIKLRAPHPGGTHIPSSTIMVAALLLLSLALSPPRPSRRVPDQRQLAELKSPGSFQQLATNMLPTTAAVTFRAWPALNDDDIRLAVNAGRRFRLHLQDDDPTRSDT
jgi:hypothetical protein